MHEFGLSFNDLEEMTYEQFDAMQMYLIEKAKKEKRAARKGQRRPRKRR